jgi:hypothetical protein
VCLSVCLHAYIHTYIHTYIHKSVPDMFLDFGRLNRTGGSKRERKCTTSQGEFCVCVCVCVCALWVCMCLLVCMHTYGWVKEGEEVYYEPG